MKIEVVFWLLLQLVLCLFRLRWELLPKMTAEHAHRSRIKEANRICLFRQDLATEIPQLQDYLSRKAEVCPYWQRPLETTEGRSATERPPQLVQSLTHTDTKVNAGAGPASGSRGPRTPEQLGRSGVPVPVTPPPALQQGAPHDEHRHSSAAHEALRSQTRMLLSQVKRALSSHQLTGILQGQENLICKVPCSFMQLLYSLLSFFSRRGG